MQRIRMKHDAPPQPIWHNDTEEALGTFLPGLGYWITAENSNIAHAMVRNGYAIYETAADAPLSTTGPLKLRSAEGQVAGFMEVKD